MHGIPTPPSPTGLKLHSDGTLRKMTNEERKAAGLTVAPSYMDESNRKIHNLLADLGFLLISSFDQRQHSISIRNIFQRKTPQTNIIVELDFGTVKVAHGSVKIDHVYEVIERDEALSKLERIIHQVSLRQIDEQEAQSQQGVA